MLNIFSVNYDGRLDAFCINANCSYKDFLEITTGAEFNLAIQRKIITDSKIYKTLRADLKRGCVLPPIVIALDAKVSTTTQLSEAVSSQANLEIIQNDVRNSINQCNVYIIDGLQRTNAIRQTLEEIKTENPKEENSFLSNIIRLEIWVNISFEAIAYRMLLLNAGQKPMSIKHQIEILSLKLRDDLRTINGIDIFTSLEKRRRRQPGQFHLSTLAQSFQAWLQRKPSIDIRNTVMEELLAESAIETLGSSLSGHGNNDDFRKIIEWIVSADHSIGLENIDFFGNETVMLGLCAAVGDFSSDDELREDMEAALRRLKEEINKYGASALGISLFDKLRRGIDTKKQNVGVATREMVSNAFSAYFYAAGKKDMDSCWQKAAK